MLIRAEEPRDVAAVFAVHELAFGRPDEARLVDALRGGAWWIPALSLLAEEGGAVVGHVLFTRVDVRDGDVAHAALALAPVGVRPEHQGTGIGSRLIRAGMERAREDGHRLVILLGHPKYYPRFGFERASPHGIRYPGPVNDAAFMLAQLVPGALAGVRGVVEYPPPFSAF